MATGRPSNHVIYSIRDFLMRFQMHCSEQNRNVAMAVCGTVIARGPASILPRLLCSIAFMR